jgi:hypothetical protein
MIAALAKAVPTAATSLFRRFIPMLIPTFQYSRSGCPITLPMEDCEDAEMACGTFQERCDARGESRLPSHFIKTRSEILRVSSAPGRKPKIASVAHRRVTGSVLSHIPED